MSFHDCHYTKNKGYDDYFGQGQHEYGYEDSGDFALDGFFCNGNEASIFDCFRYMGFWNDDCDPKENAAVECTCKKYLESIKAWSRKLHIHTKSKF